MRLCIEGAPFFEERDASDPTMRRVEVRLSNAWLDGSRAGRLGLLLYQQLYQPPLLFE